MVKIIVPRRVDSGTGERSDSQLKGRADSAARVEQAGQVRAIADSRHREVDREATTPTEFLPTSRGGRFKQKDPTVPADALRGRWHAGTPILNVGKADSLRARIQTLLRFATDDPVGHWGGRYLWQVEGSEAFLVGWREEDDPRRLERELLADFAAHFGSLPFANLVG